MDQLIFSPTSGLKRPQLYSVDPRVVHLLVHAMYYQEQYVIILIVIQMILEKLSGA